MKSKIIICLLLLTNIIQPKEEKKLSSEAAMSLEKITVWAQEILYLQFVLPTWLDYQKATDATIYCNVCNRAINSFEFYGQLTGLAKAQDIANLKEIWRAQTIEKIEAFLEEVSNNIQIVCATCQASHGWHKTLRQIS